MHNSRFWTGLVFLTGVPVSLLMGKMWGEPVQYANLEGVITYQGHPIQRGVILFESLDRKCSGDIVIEVDGSGRFGREVDWRADLQGRSRFRIYVSSDPRPSPTGQLMAQPAMIGVSEALAPGAAPGTADQRSSPDWDRRFPEVWLGPEPTRLEIDLKD